MNICRKLKNWVRKFLKKGNLFSMEKALKRCKDNRFKFSTIIDIGASDGRWSEVCMKFYPGSQYFLIEAQKEHEKELKRFRDMHKNVNYIISAAGDKEGTIFFDNESLFGGTASYDKFEQNCVEVKMTTIDFIVEEKGLMPPFLLKLDTHGFEEKIFKGAEKTLKNTEMLIVEAYAHPINETFRFFELCAFLKEKGFLPVEIVDLMLRPYDNSLWQMDIMFIKDNSDKFKYDEYE